MLDFKTKQKINSTQLYSPLKTVSERFDRMHGRIFRADTISSLYPQ